MPDMTYDLPGDVDLAACILRLRPHARASIRGRTVVMEDPPSEAEMLSAWDDVLAERAARAAEPTAEDVVAAVVSLADEGGQHEVERRIRDRAAQIAQQRAG